MVQLARNRVMTYQLWVPNTLLNSCLPVGYTMPPKLRICIMFHKLLLLRFILFYIILFWNVVLGRKMQFTCTNREQNAVHMHQPWAKCSSHAPVVSKMQYDKRIEEVILITPEGNTITEKCKWIRHTWCSNCLTEHVTEEKRGMTRKTT
jgi:hypothetical protein